MAQTGYFSIVATVPSLTFLTPHGHARPGPWVAGNTGPRAAGHGRTAKCIAAVPIGGPPAAASAMRSGPLAGPFVSRSPLRAGTLAASRHSSPGPTPIPSCHLLSRCQGGAPARAGAAVAGPHAHPPGRMRTLPGEPGTAAGPGRRRPAVPRRQTRRQAARPARTARAAARRRAGLGGGGAGHGGVELGDELLERPEQEGGGGAGRGRAAGA